MIAATDSDKLLPPGDLDGSPSTATRNHFEPRHQAELDGIRGIAILAVMFSHTVVQLGVLQLENPHTRWAAIVAYLVIPGWGGVDLFFVLSGFLITGILLKARIRSTYFTSFYARRVLRIFPVYYLFLTLSLIAGYIWPAFGALLPATARERTSYFLYLQNWPIFWANWGGMVSQWSVFWSLAVEEQFYLVWPTLVRFLNIPIMLGICVVGFLLGAPLRWWVIHHLTGVQVGVLQFPLSRLDGLFIGAACALYREYSGEIVPLKWGALCFSAGVLMMLYIAAVSHTEFYGIGVHISTFGVTAYALMSGGLLVASQHPVRHLRQFLSWRPLVIAGKYSYGMYVYHSTVFLGFHVLAQHIWRAGGGKTTIIPAVLFMTAAIATSAGVAAVSFHFFEEPFLRLKRFFPSPSAPVVK